MKYFFAILFSFSSLFSYSQLPDGSIAPNFTTTDVNGIYLLTIKTNTGLINKRVVIQ